MIDSVPNQLASRWNLSQYAVVLPDLEHQDPRGGNLAFRYLSVKFSTKP